MLISNFVYFVQKKSLLSAKRGMYADRSCNIRRKEERTRARNNKFINSIAEERLQEFTIFCVINKHQLLIILLVTVSHESALIIQYYIIQCDYIIRYVYITVSSLALTTMRKQLSKYLKYLKYLLVPFL